MARESLWAVVPLKDARRAKQRLAPLLAAQQRMGLARAMARDVLLALGRVRDLAGILVVAGDPAVRELARPVGARVIDETLSPGMRAAVAAAAQALARDRAAGMLVVPADLPLITPAEIETVLAAHGDAPAVTLVPAIADQGSNGLACSPVDVIPPLFGPRSSVRHREAALARGVQPCVLPLPGWGRDIDRPDDLLAFAATPSDTRTYAYLERLGIVGRLRAAARGGAWTASAMRRVG
ncbi:MAG: 2-phospho-L-lactate guanylyltransferase [Geminicoccales bacterium]